MRTATASAKPRTVASTWTSAMRGTLAGCRLARTLTPGIRDGDAEGARAHGQHERFGEQLPREPSLVGADGQPQRQLALPRGRAREVEVRDVQAGDREEQNRGAEEEEEHGPRRRRQRLTQGNGGGVGHPRADRRSAA